MKVLEVNGVKKKIGKRVIIKNLSFSVDEGQIFGFLGPNGAGKTTTIRMIVGLIKPTEGDILLCGKSITKNTEEALKNIGAVVENPESYKYLSGRENLMQIARVRNVSSDKVQELIDLVGLKDRIDDKVSKYSLGMKQRLGLAAALIGEPKILILDEPTNGLDPSGIMDFREIVKKAAKEKNIAVFISSHILSEIQTLCDRVAFINGGVIKAVEDMAENMDKNTLESVTINSKDKEKIKDILAKAKEVTNIQVMDNEIRILVEKAYTSEVLRKLVLNGADVKEFYLNRNELEERYMELVEGGLR